MRRIRLCLGFGRSAKAATAALVVALILILGAFAVSPSLHQRVHTDCNGSDSLCVVCAFASGHLIGPCVIAAIAVACVLLTDIVFLPATPLISYLNFYFLPNRAPPRPPLFN
jgi:hypothetical protein